MSIVRALRALALLALLLPAGCSRTPATPPNIVLVLIDTLRPDRLGVYGNTRGLSPFLDELAARSTVFDNAYAQSSWTSASVASLFTSRYQSQTGVTSFSSVLPAEEDTLAEALRAGGYDSGAFVANFLLRANLGYDQGFATFDNYARIDPTTPGQIEKASADRINREALAWLDHRPIQAPRFLYLHYMEPHVPFAPRPEALATVMGDQPLPDAAAVNQAFRIWTLVDFSKDPALMQATKDLYDAEVLSIDMALRELFTELGRRGVLDDAIVVVMADHGEEFLEHGLIGHDKTLYEEVIRVPLIIHLPGQRARYDVRRNVSLVDVAPTLLDLAGIARPAAYEGRSLAPLLRRGRDGAWSLAGLRNWFAARTAGEPPVVSELIKVANATRYSPHERAVIIGSDKMIAGVDGQREFYELASDPAERHGDAVAAPVRAALERVTEPLQAAAAHGGDGTGGAAVIDEDTKERMRALGYTH
ncbi:sulfatase [bacterium]|nr:sulfatase [bacterium]